MENLVQMASANTKTQEKPTKTQEELRSTLEKKLVNLESTFNEAVSMYEQALENNTFEDADDEDEGMGEKRKQDLQNKILKILERGEVMRARLDGGELIPDMPEFDLEKIKSFMTETFTIWYSKDQAENVKQVPTPTAPTDLDFSALENTPDPSKFGEYTLNPECAGLDYENVKIQSLDITKEAWYKTLPNKKLSTVFQYITTHYGDSHILPDLTYYQYIIENPTKADPAIKDGKYYFFPGSVLRLSNGDACVPFSYWNGSSFNRHANHLGNQWDGNYRVLLLEK